MSTASFCGWPDGQNKKEFISEYPLEINSCYRETLFDGALPMIFFIASSLVFIFYQPKAPSIHPRHPSDLLRLPTSKAVSVFKRSLVLLVLTLLEISSWAFLFAWRLESVILERSKKSPTTEPSPPLYQLVDPGLACLPRIYILILVIKSFTTPENPLDSSKFTRYSYHFLTFYSLISLSAIMRVCDYFLTNNNWYISPSIEQSFAVIDVILCTLLWYVMMTSPTELDQAELVDFDEDEDGVLVLLDGRVVRNGRILSLESSASPLSSLTFSWMNSLLKTAYSSRLTSALLWALPIQQRAKENFRFFAQTKQSIRVTSSSILKRLYKANRKIIWWQFITAIGAVILHYANSLFLYLLLNHIEKNAHASQGQMIKEVGLMYCIALFICNVISTLIASQTLLWGRRWHVAIINMLNSEIYAHALRLKGRHTRPLDQSLGDAEDEEDDETDENYVHQKASLMSQDTERLAELASYLHIFYTCPLEIAAGAVFLYQLLGSSFLIGLVAMAIALPTTHYMSRRLMVAQAHLSDAKSWRLRLVRELCEGIKTIKFLASERRWEQIITSARDDELVKLIKLYTQNTLLGLIWFATPVFVTTISFAWYILVQEKTLNASTAFVSIVLFGMLRDPLNVMPQAYMAYGDAKTSLNHIVTFLNTEVRKDNLDLDEQQAYHEHAKIGFVSAQSTFEWGPGMSFSEGHQHQQHQHQIGKQYDTFAPSLPPTKRPLRSRTMTYGSTASTPFAFGSNETSTFRLVIDQPFLFPTARLSVISGPSQSGKTSLLVSLLGDMTMTTGDKVPLLPSRFLYQQQGLVRDGSFYLHKVAYVAQIPWIEHGTIRDNILFFEAWDDARYRTVLHQCDLLRDLSLFDNGDLTLSSEKGVTGSDTLKHKISLARAVYSRCKTVIIDDIFMILGKSTSTFIYENCIRGDLMKGRTVLVAVTYPDIFWAKDAQLFVRMAAPLHDEGHIETLETDPERIVQLIKLRRNEQQQKKENLKQEKTAFEESTVSDETRHQKSFVNSAQVHEADVVDVLFEYTGGAGSIHNNTSTLFDEDVFDDTSLMPDPIEQEEELSSEERRKRRDFAYATYASACGGWRYWIAAILFTLLARLASISESFWLKIWSMAGSHFDEITDKSTAATTLTPSQYVLIYLGLCLVAVICNFIRTVIQYRGSLQASNRIFLSLLQSVCHAPLKFFDVTSVSLIMSRFSKDIDTVDSSIGWHINFLLQTIFGVFGVVFTVGIIIPEFFLVGIIAAIVYLYIGFIYVRASRELKRINDESRPPIFHLYHDTLVGLATIRAYGEEWSMMKKMFDRLDDHMRSFYTLWNTNRWLFVRVELLGALLSLFVGASIVFNTIDAGLAGIALTLSNSLMEYVYWLMRQSTTVGTHFESIERINDYIIMPQEPPSIVEGSRPPASWPTNAAVQVKDLVVGLNNSEADAVLRHVSFNIFPGEKVALVSRAGAEKHALVSCLFRFMEPLRGSIKIDGINTAWIGVEDLRSRITFISKEGWLLNGTVRSNLDPFGEYDDYALWQVLYQVKLVNSPTDFHPFVSIDDLDKDLGKRGCRLSVCQRQLLCIARALLQDCTKLIIVEEARLEPEEKALVQTVIDQEFEESTILVIPYILRDVVNYDKVMVFDQGVLVEYDSPTELLNKQHGLLTSLCEKAGILDSLTLYMNEPS
ncbi:ABC transporter type 1, transmembrane domain-containing protein [Blakeslea trispora]|nr:ABC transporter type 1, transmembrane domain-containing protein [Blakeslea trispora]